MRRATPAGALRHAAARVVARVRACTRQRWWPWARRAAVAAIVVVVVALLLRQARQIDWAQVWLAVRRQPPAALFAAAALTAASYLAYACFDLAARHYTRHRVTGWRVVLTAVTSYACNLTLGSAVGGLGVRHRLYVRFGVSTGTVLRIVSFAVITNWIGYLVLAGPLCMLHPPVWPPGWSQAWFAGPFASRALGALLFAAAAGWVAACRWSKRRELVIGGEPIELPSAPVALVQAVCGAVNWLLIAAVVWTLLHGRVAYVDVLAVQLLAAVAGLAVHMPASLGVIEGVFLALLGHRVPQGELLGALLCYRALYFLLPLGLALPALAAGELRRSSAGDGADRAAPACSGAP